MFRFQTLDALFEILDVEEKGELDYSQYMWAVIGNMIEARKSLVRKVRQDTHIVKHGIKWRSTFLRQVDLCGFSRLLSVSSVFYFHSGLWHIS